MESRLISLLGDNMTANKRLKLEHLGRCRSTTKELPEEIMNDEILIRLPVETVLRVRSVCKSWESLFFTPQFSQSHFKTSLNKNSIYQDCLLAFKYGATVLLTRYNETPLRPPAPKVATLANTCLVGSINGLVCLVNHIYFFLWNPIIGRYKEFTVPQQYPRYNDPYNPPAHRYRYLIGFGWDCLKNDYQVVVCYIYPHFRQGIVYSSNSNSWSKLVVPAFIFPSHIYDATPFGKECVVATTNVKECPYWCYTNFLRKMRRKYTTIVKFDIQTQKFRSLPEIDYALVRGNDYNFINLKDCLAIMVYRSNCPNTSVEVYILQENSGVWNKMCTIGSLQSKLNIGSLLPSFKFGGEIVLQSEEKVLCYDPESDEVKGFVGSICYKVSKCCNYTASLVFLQGMERVQKRKQFSL